MKPTLLLSAFAILTMSESAMVLDRPSAIAHGLKLQAQLKSTVEVSALYEDGTPLKQAQIKIYKPNQAEEAAVTGVTDDNGIFHFTPDQSGNWEIFVRQAGHGGEVSVPIDFSPQGETLMASTPTPGQTLPQRIITIGAVMWGCIGTALYFKGRSK